jgi:sugar phosphate isomerase/epimerase
MKVAARPFRNAQDSVEYCRKLGVDTAIMECNKISGWAERGYLETNAISETLKILDQGGISCSVLVLETIPVINREPQDNEILQNAIKTIHAMGRAEVSTLLLFMLEEIKEGAERKDLWQFFLNHHRYVIEAAAAADVNIAMHGYFPPIGLVDGNAFFASSFAELPDIHNGICYDPGIMAICGDDPLEGLEAFKERIYMVHIRDVKGDWRSVENVKRDALQLEVFPGKGIAKIELVMRRLYEIGYRGVVQPEHLGPPSEAELLPAAIKYLKDLINRFETGGK